MLVQLSCFLCVLQSWVQFAIFLVHCALQLTALALSKSSVGTLFGEFRRFCARCTLLGRPRPASGVPDLGHESDEFRQLSLSFVPSSCRLYWNVRLVVWHR
jgi:hypothetical protein